MSNNSTDDYKSVNEGSKPYRFSSMNEAADWWRGAVRIDIVPAAGKAPKEGFIWKDISDGKKIITNAEHEDRKLNNDYRNGFVAVTGLMRRAADVGVYYFIGVDLDSPEAIKAFCFINGRQWTLEELAATGKFLIDQTEDKTRAHVYFFSNKEYTNLNPNIAKIEVKCSNRIITLAPTQYEDGRVRQLLNDHKSMLKFAHNYESIEWVEEHINTIVSKQGVEYLNGKADKNTNRVPIYKDGNEDDDSIKWKQGERFVKLNSWACSNCQRLTDIEDIRALVYAKDKRKCESSLEFDKPLGQLEKICQNVKKLGDERRAKESVRSYDTYDTLHTVKEQEEKERSTKAEKTLLVANNSIQKLFIDEYQVPHGAILVQDHLEILQLGSRRFRNYLASQIHKENKTVLDPQTLKSVVDILKAKAEFDSGDPIKLNLRVAEVQNNGSPTWYYDLTNKDWEFIEITPNGWNIRKNQDPNLILFHRYNNQQAQAYPSRDYDPDILDQFIELVLNKSNVKDDEKLEEYRILLKCYIICAFIADFPKAIPMPHGGQGAAKTSLMEFVKKLIDPSIMLTLSFPRGVTELIQQLGHNYVAYYDNVSILSDLISDAICRAVSGSGSSKRVLYTDNDDFIQTLMRLIGINGINLAATKPDLLDRGLFFDLTRIADKDRKYIKKIKKDFEDMKPQLLGYIFDILVKVMVWIQKNGMLELDKLPRMADWAGHCEIISRCMGLEDGKFIEAYKNNAKIQVEEIMETSLVATCLANLVETIEFNAKGLDGKPLGYQGTANELKKKLEAIALELGIDTRDHNWPKQANGLTKIINIIKHTLEEAGIEINYSRPKNVKIITIRKTTI